MADDKATILSVLNSFLGSVKARKPADMRQYVVPDGAGVFERDNGILTTTMSGLVDRVEKRVNEAASGSVIEETVHDTQVQVDENLGMVWAPFQHTVDGKVDYHGTTVYMMLRTKEGWKISGAYQNHKA